MEILVLFYIFIIGLFFGSFLNVLIDRLPNEESVMGRSHCDYCKKTLTIVDLIPVFSFVFLGGKCRRCKKKLSFQYPAMEILTGVIFVLIWIYAPVDSRLWTSQNHTSILFSKLSSFSVILANAGIHGFLIELGMTITDGIIRLLYLGLISTLIVIFFADLKYQIIPDSMQVSFAVFSTLIVLSQATSLNGLADHAVAAFALMFCLLALFLGTKGRGMGFGDVKFAFSMGLLLGLKSGFMALYLSFIAGAIVGILLLSLRHLKMKSKIPFGPFLIFGTLVMIFQGNYILHLLYKLYGF